VKFNKGFYKKLTKKLNELGCTDPTFGPIAADLNDLTEASSDYLEAINKLLEIDSTNSDLVLDNLIRLKTIMEHFEFHIKSGLPLVDKLIDIID
jgi:hypothetical protein